MDESSPSRCPNQENIQDSQLLSILFQFQIFNIFIAHTSNLHTATLVSLSVHQAQKFLKLNDGVKQDGEDFSPLSDSIPDTPRRSCKSPRIQLQLEGTRMDFYDQEVQQHEGIETSPWPNLETWIHL